jgi:hypothetical protein
MIKKRKRKVSFQLNVLKAMRKEMPPPTRIIHPKKCYDRRDQSWKDIDEDE